MKVGAEELAHTVRNSAPILEVLKEAFKDSRRVLEIGSGNGQHAVVFAAELSHVSWQTSDLAINHESIRYWLERSGGDNLIAPIELDVSVHDVNSESFDAVFSANTAHYPPERLLGFFHLKQFAYDPLPVPPSGVWHLAPTVVPLGSLRDDQPVVPHP